MKSVRQVIGIGLIFCGTAVATSSLASGPALNTLSNVRMPFTNDTQNEHHVVVKKSQTYPFTPHLNSALSFGSGKGRPFR